MQQRLGHAGCRIDPQPHRERRHGEFGHYARHPHQHAHALVRESRSLGGIDIRHRHQYQEHQAHLVAGAAETLDCQAVTQFVYCLEHRKSECKQQHILRREGARGQIGGKLVPVPGHLQDGREYEQAPGPRQDVPERLGQQRHHALDQLVRVDQRKLERERIGDVLLELLPAQALAAFAQFRNIRRHVREQHVGLVQLRQQLHHLVLCRRRIAVAPADKIPDLVQRSPAVQQHNQLPCGRIEAQKAAAGPVLQHMPYFPAIAVAYPPRLGAQARPQSGDAVPGSGKQRGTHTPSQVQACRRAQSSKPCVQIQIRYSRLMSILPIPSMPGRRRLLACSSVASTRK